MSTALSVYAPVSQLSLSLGFISLVGLGAVLFSVITISKAYKKALERVSTLEEALERVSRLVEQAKKAELFEITHTDRATRANHYDFIATLTRACITHDFEQIDAWIAEGMNPTTLFQGPNGGAFTHLINGPEDKVCKFITKLKEVHRIKFVPLQFGDPKKDHTLHQGYVKLALSYNRPKTAKRLYELGAEFDGSFN